MVEKIGFAHIDSFSSSIAELPPAERTPANALRCLRDNPRVSAFDMSEHLWIRRLVSELEHRKLITNIGGTYPWCNYRVEGLAK